MRLATVRTAGDGTTGDATAAVLIDGDEAIEIGPADVGELLSRPDWRARAAAADGVRHRLATVSYASLISRPGKVFCVGLNYRTHILEMGRELPEFPTVFAKFADTLTGPYDPIEAPAEDELLDWEAELAVVIGAEIRRGDAAAATAAIAGYTVANDVTLRGFQYRTKEWLQGKMWERSTPVGPLLVTPDEWQPGPEISTQVNGQPRQRAGTDDLVHDPSTLVGYLSTMITLRPGDLILTGTPGGVGHARKPPSYLRPGDVLETSIEGIGRLRNQIVTAGWSR